VKGAKAAPTPSAAQVPAEFGVGSAGNQVMGNPLAPLLAAQNAQALGSFNPFAEMGINTNDPNYVSYISPLTVPVLYSDGGIRGEQKDEMDIADEWFYRWLRWWIHLKLKLVLPICWIILLLLIKWVGQSSPSIGQPNQKLIVIITSSVNRDQSWITTNGTSS
jgi:hypothetical protein